MLNPSGTLKREKNSLVGLKTKKKLNTSRINIDEENLHYSMKDSQGLQNPPFRKTKLSKRYKFPEWQNKKPQYPTRTAQFHLFFTTTCLLTYTMWKLRNLSSKISSEIKNVTDISKWN
jgi:hypothetical protein